jgi:hypothetical protein
MYYKILISSRAATISWWDRRFACHRRLQAGVWLRLCSLMEQGDVFRARSAHATDMLPKGRFTL